MNNYETYIQKNIDDSFRYQEGKRKPRALTMVMKHLYNKHNLPYFVFSPYPFREHSIFYSAFPEAK